jgi:hypothetical protein
MKYHKSSRVKIIKNNIEKGESIPPSLHDCDIGKWADDQLSARGHVVDPYGIIDLPEYKTDTKTRNKYSKANHTVGSMTIEDILSTPDWFETRFHKKTLNQNQIEWDPDFQEVSNVTILDMDLFEIQDPLKKAYENLRKKVLDGDRRKNIISDCKWAVFDGYNHKNSYRYRITNNAMKKIKNMSKSRDSRKGLFDE